MWQFFSERISQYFLLNTDILIRTLSASLNKYQPRLFNGKSEEDYALAKRIVSEKSNKLSAKTYFKW